MTNLTRSLVAVGLALLAGCASTSQTDGQRSMRKLADQLEAYADSLDKSGVTVQQTLTVHENLVLIKDGDLRSHYEALARQIDRLVSRQLLAATQRDEIGFEAQAYFERWEAGLDVIGDEVLRESSEQTLEQRREHFKALAQTATAAWEAFDPMLGMLRDHALFLSNDLTPTAATSLSRSTASLREMAGSLQRALEAAALEARELAGRLRQHAPR